MTDLEVGKMWAMNYGQGWHGDARIKQLILKLVEERKWKHFPVIETSGSGDLISWDISKAEAAALRDFGIDPSSFSKEFEP